MSDGMVPNGVTPDSYLDVVSLQLAIFLFAVCHVVVVVMESGDLDVVLRYDHLSILFFVKSCIHFI